MIILITFLPNEIKHHLGYLVLLPFKSDMSGLGTGRPRTCPYEIINRIFISAWRCPFHPILPFTGAKYSDLTNIENLG